MQAGKLLENLQYPHFVLISSRKTPKEGSLLSGGFFSLVGSHAACKVTSTSLECLLFGDFLCFK